ncbi:MAG: SpoIIE family protein phosphatase, partial [Bryobacteraceae bacterium]
MIPLFCLLLGYWVALARPFDLNAWLVLLILSYPESLMSSSVYQWWPGIWLVLRLYWHLGLLVSASLALFWLGLLFPQRSRIDVWLPWLKWCVLALFACGLAVALLLEYDAWFDLDLLANVAQIDAANNSVILWTTAFCAIFYWIALFGRPGTALPADARRRLRVLRAGSVIGLGSMLIIYGGLPWFGIAHPAKIHWLYILSAILMLAFPLSLAYVVIVQRAMDVPILLRMSSKYLLASTTAKVARVAGIAALLWFIAIPLVTHHHTPQKTAFLSAVLLIFGFLFLKRKSPTDLLQQWIDRKFFREAYDAEVMLSQLAKTAQTISDPAALIRTVSQRISDVLHVDQLSVLLRRNGNFEPAYAIGPALTAPLGALGRSHVSSTPMFNSANDGRTPDPQSPELLLPLPGRTELLGAMALGPKRSEAPYTPTDLRLLESVAVQTGLGLELSEAAASLAAAAVERARVAREIEIAREVQERLFPQVMPSLPCLDIAGHCRPAAGVGGDYYDVFQLDDGRLALALGDIAGKGISAALLMASLRASLRSIAEDGSDDLPKLVSKLNRQVYQASAVNRYATFFFGVLTPSTLQLRYVNAGHNPPFIIRDGPEGRGRIDPLRLETGGTVVGLLKETAYLEGMVQFQPGDVFVTYTDGVSEAMARDDEEWGEQRMIASCAAAHERAAGEILQCMMNAA